MASVLTWMSARQRLLRRILIAAGIVVLIVAWGVLPLMMTDSSLDGLSYSGVFAIAAVGLVLLSGYGGQSSFAQPAFMAIGAYTAVNLGSVAGLPFLVYLILAMLIAGAVGAIVGLLALRLEGQQLAVVTLGVLLVSQYVALDAEGITGGENGKSAAAASLAIGPVDFRKLGDFTASQSEFWLVWVIVAIVAIASVRVLSLRPGKSLVSVRVNARAAAALGVNVRVEKLKAFTWASALGGLAGALYAALQQYATPGDFGLIPAVLLLAMLVIGGADSVGGAILGAIIVWGGKGWVADSSRTGGSLSWLVKTPGSTQGFITPGDLVTLVFGLAIIVVLIFSPGGIWGAGRRGLARRGARNKRTPANQNA